jgi:hypothetical protein
MDTTEVIKRGKKEKHLNTLQKYYIYRISKDNTHQHIQRHIRDPVRTLHQTAEHIPSPHVKAELVTHNVHNLCTHKLSNYITSPTAWQNIQVALNVK